MRFIFMGDILHPGRVVVVAGNMEEALEKIDEGDFEVYDEAGKNLAFNWNGDESTVEVMQ